MERNICRGMAAAALVAATSLPMCAGTAYADVLDWKDPLTDATQTAISTTSEAIVLSECVALVIAGASLLRRKKEDPAETKADEQASAGQQIPNSHGTMHDSESSADTGDRDGEASNAGQPGCSRCKTSRITYASWVMCQTLKWLMPTAVLVIWAKAGITVSGMLGSSVDHTAVVGLIAHIPIMTLAVALSVAYLHKSSQSLEEMLLPVDRKPEAKSPLERCWMRVLLFSGGLFLANIYGSTTPIGLALYATVILMSSAPFVMNHREPMRERHPDRPARQSAIDGIILGIVTIVIAGLGIAVTLVLMLAIAFLVNTLWEVLA